MVYISSITGYMDMIFARDWNISFVIWISNSFNGKIQNKSQFLIQTLTLHKGNWVITYTAYFSHFFLLLFLSQFLFFPSHATRVSISSSSQRSNCSGRSSSLWNFMSSRSPISNRVWRFQIISTHFLSAAMKTDYGNWASYNPLI